MPSPKLPVSKPRNSSEETRRRLLDAGLVAFGELGFDAVGTRDLAEKAQANQAAIPYHFGGKEGLYMAVVEDLVADAKVSVGTVAALIEERLEQGTISPDEGETLIADMIAKMVGFLVGAGRARFRAALVIRELMHPSAAFELLFDGYMRQVHTTFTRLVAAMLDEDPDAESSMLRAHALLGQVVMFGAGRELIRRRANWNDLTEEHLKRIAEGVTETLLASVRGMRASRGLPEI